MPEPRHLTLGELIAGLEAEHPAKRLKVGFHRPHSYRGYYEQLAFEMAENVTVGEMLADAKAALGATYQGWKGGDYTMDAYTEVWLVAEEGDCGESLGAVLLSLMLANVAEPGTTGIDLSGMELPVVSYAPDALERLSQLPDATITLNGYLLPAREHTDRPDCWCGPLPVTALVHHSGLPAKSEG